MTSAHDRDADTAWVGRHPSVVHFEKLFKYDHLPPKLLATSKAFHDLAVGMLLTQEDSPELAAGLRKLLEAKDCFVRNIVLTQ